VSDEQAVASGPRATPPGSPGAPEAGPRTALADSGDSPATLLTLLVIMLALLAGQLLVTGERYLAGVRACRRLVAGLIGG
jgi:hypothetical protein